MKQGWEIEKLVEVIDNPDRWMIVLTIINIVAFVVVAYTQIKQQKQQRAIHAFVIYDKPYRIMQSVENIANLLIFNIAYYFQEDSTCYKAFDNEYWEKKCIEIKKLQDDMSQLCLDLILPKDISNKHPKIMYNLLIDSMFFLVKEMNNIGNTEICVPKLKQDTITKEGVKYLINCIKTELNKKNINDSSALKSFNDKFNLFLKCRKSVVEMKALSILREKFKID